MATDVMIEASGLTKRFGSTRALDKVSFEVKKGEVVGFLGPNGAGKSTTMRILTCFTSPTNGTAKVKGFDVFDNPLGVRQSLGYLPQRAPLYADMTVYDYLHFAAQIRGLDDSKFKSRLKKVIEVCGLAQSLGKDISTLSHGYRQRVGLGQALIHDPPILILDEPTSDLDPNEKAEVLKYIKEIGKDRTILLSTHNLSEVEEACARAIIVSKGRVVADGPLDDIRAKTGRVRYIVTIDEKRAEAGSKAPGAKEVDEALHKLSGATAIRELPTDESAHKFELSGPQDGDLRAEIFRLIVAKSWTLLELRKDAQSLDAVFRDLTRGDEKLDRGADWDSGEDDEDEDDEDDDKSRKPAAKAAAAAAAAADDDEDDEDDDDEDDEDDEDDDAGAQKPQGKG
ncbi:MAG TPA: ATP-binding cassette domain-containing protein [Polyangiaceae bacterium]|nr:ATP-binding cassette domain-containing protein [Polyangiaceae bacterium]